MTRITFLRIIIVQLAFMFCLSSTASAVQGESLGSPASAKRDSTKAGAATQQSDRKVLNIVIDKIENGNIYTKEGKVYQMSSGTKTIDNSKTVAGTKQRIAELVYDGGTLVSVTIK